ncbi:hypothetical protein BpHYR1_011694 [Brachionus plicatilis]|uniref:Uncharacterized protein n=1 Tax=Brachionus plicatilis TaxID=10195 RepID=A0A3M7QAB1_BRAPC|nr:hypothetical protein BpHYR1_011694 [Brachionus plicatilis]
MFTKKKEVKKGMLEDNFKVCLLKLMSEFLLDINFKVNGFQKDQHTDLSKLVNGIFEHFEKCGQKPPIFDNDILILASDKLQANRMQVERNYFDKMSQSLMTLFKQSLIEENIWFKYEALIENKILSE